MSYNPRQSTDYDVFAGSVLKKLRHSKLLTQKSLANMLNITFQQCQKYENGTNRITLNLICEACKIFNVSPMEFFKPEFSIAQFAQIEELKQLVDFYIGLEENAQKAILEVIKNAK